MEKIIEQFFAKNVTTSFSNILALIAFVEQEITASYYVWVRSVSEKERLWS